MASLIDLVNPIITPLYNLTLRHAVYLLTAGKNVEDLTEATKNLAAKSEDVQTQIDIANRQGLSATNEVQWWLEKVHTIKSKEEVIRGKYDHRYKIFGCCSFNCWSNYKISKDAAKMLLQVKDCLSSTPSVVAAQVLPPPVQEMPCPSTEQQPTRDVNLQKALQYIKNDLMGMIGIWGLGGVGKTVLLKNINNSFRGDSYFDHVIFVTASKECSVRKVQDEIIQKLGLTNDAHVESQARVISDFLQKRSFMILLDDLWERIDLQEVGIPYPLGSANQLKTKVVLTTRSLDICHQMKVSKEIKVACLLEDEAWQLFQENVSQETLSSSPRIEYLARELLKELKGLPLAVITTGRAMNGKSEPREWELAIHHMQNSCCDNDDPLSMESVYKRLMFSYDSLRNDTLRQCFLTCSLWPEDKEIDNDELVQSWMGLGLVDKYDNIQISCKKLYSIIGDLKAACLLESCGESGNFVKMHDVVRDMAIWISCDRGQNKDKWVVRAGVGTELSANTIPWSKADYVSLMYNAMNELPPFGLSPCSTQLRTLCLQYNNLDARIAGTIKNFTALTYLDLRWNRLKIIPDELCALVNLEYLNLSGNLLIKKVPSCFGNLIKLKFLYIELNNIRTIPKEVISSLKALQVLDLRNRGGGREYVVNYVPSVLQELGTLPNFKALGINLDGASEYELLGEAHIPVRELTLSGVEEAPEFCLSGSPFSNDFVRRSLYVLEIAESSMEEITLVRREGCEPNYCFDYLDSLGFFNLQSLREITWKGVSPQDLFPRLTRLCILGCSELEHVSLAMYLPWLEQLEVSACFNIKQAFPSIENHGVKMCSGQGSSVTPTDAFPCLKILRLEVLKLVSICNSDVTFRSLEYLEVQYCENLKGLPFRMQSMPLKLQELHICSELWEKLEMEEGVKSKLQPFLRFTQG